MADKPTKAELAKLPGGESFDVDNASSEDYAKHVEILRRRQEVAGLTPQTLTAEAGDGQSTPTGDIKAVKDGDTRYFNQETWDAMETSGKHDGWEVAVEKPKG